MNTTCTICSEDLFTGEEEESVNSTLCGHVYHSQCLLRWMERSKTCPICRSNLEEYNLIKLKFTYGESLWKTARIADFQKRVEQLHKAELDLKMKLDVKRVKFQELVQNNRDVNSAYEKQSIEVLQLVQTESNLRNQLAMKSEALRELQENHTSAILVCDELRTKNMKLEDRVQWLLNAELGLRNELQVKNMKLEQMKETCKNMHSANEELRKKITESENRVQQILDIQSNLENTLDGKSKELENLEANNRELNLTCEKLRARNTEVENCMQLFVNSKFILKRRLALNTIQLQGMNKNYTNALQENEKLKTEIGALNNELEKLKFNLIREQREHNSTLGTNGVSENVQQQLRKQIETLKDILKTEQEKNYALIQEFQGLRTLKIETVDEEIQALRKEIVNLRAEVSARKK